VGKTDFLKQKPPLATGERNLAKGWEEEAKERMYSI
jgi:hypothetical protein